LNSTPHKIQLQSPESWSMMDMPHSKLIHYVIYIYQSETCEVVNYYVDYPNVALFKWFVK
jgi:hypothetical protein